MESYHLYYCEHVETLLCHWKRQNCYWFRLHFPPTPKIKRTKANTFAESISEHRSDTIRKLIQADNHKDT